MNEEKEIEKTSEQKGYEAGKKLASFVSDTIGLGIRTNPLLAPMANVYDAIFNDDYAEDIKERVESESPLFQNRFAARIREENLKDVMNLKRVVQNSEVGLDFQAWKPFADEDVSEFINRKEEIKQKRMNEMADLANSYDVMKYTVNLAGREAGFFTRFVAQPIFDTVLDVADVTDVGDMVSAARIGSFLYGAGIGDAVGATATVGKLGNAGKVLASQGAIGMVEGGIDYARYASEGLEQTPTDYVKYAALNTGANLLGYGLGKLVGKGVESIMDFKKNQVTKKLAKATTGTIPNGTEAGGKVIDAVEQSLDVATNGNGAKILAVNNAKAGEITIDSFASGEQVLKESMQLDVPGTTVMERQAAAEAINNYKLRNNISVSTPVENFRIANIPEVIDDTQEILKKNKNLALEQTQMALFNQARFKATLVEKAIKESDGNLNASHFYSVSDEQSRLVLDTIKIGYEQASENISQQLSLSISAKGSAIGINDISDFFVYSSNNSIDPMKALYNRSIGKSMPKEYQEVFGLIQSLYDKYVVKVAPSQVFSETDDIFIAAEKAGIAEKIFDVYDYIPADWDTTVIPYRIKQGLKPDDLAFFFGAKLDDPISQVGNLVKNYSAKRYNHQLDDKAIEILQNSIGKTKKQIVSELKEAGLRNTDAEYMYKFMKKMSTDNNAISAEGEQIVKAIKKEYRQLGTRENRVWQYFNKKEVLKYEDFRIVKNDEFGNPLLTREVLPLEQAKLRWTPEQAQEYGEIIQEVKHSFGTQDPVLDKAYNGIELKVGKNSTTIGDMRTVTVGQYYDNMFGKGSWEKLSPVDRIKVANGKIGNKIAKNEVSKVGSDIINKWGTDDIEYIANGYMDKWKITGKVKMNINNSASKFNASTKTISTNAGKAYEVTLDFPAGMSKKEQIGILRHELQHVYESEFTNKLSDSEFINKIFRNEPGIVDEKFLAKIAGNEPVSLRELSGQYYNNHFYIPSNDSFETSYLSYKLREHYNSLTDDDKFLHFLQAVDSSRAVVDKGKTTVKDIFGFGTNAKAIPEFLSDVIDNTTEIPEDFVFKSFKSEDDMIDFISYLTNKGNNGATNIDVAYSKIQTSMRNEAVGFSPNQLLRSLNTKNVRKAIKAAGLDTRISSTDTEAILNTYRETLRAGFINKPSQTVNAYSNYEMFKTGVTTAIIGNRYYKDAIVANVNSALGKIYNGDIKGGVLDIFKNAPTAYKYMTRSWAYQGGNILEQTNIILKHVTNDLMGMNYEGRWLAHAADTLQRLGNVGTKDINIMQISNFIETQTKLNLLKAGIPLNSNRGTLAMIQAKQLQGLKTDDMVGYIMAQGNARSEFLRMIEKTSFNELTPIQQKMFHFSGVAQENFASWATNAKKAMENINLDDIPSQYANIRNVINAGISENDIVGLSRRGIKGEYSPFMYMVQTTFNIAGSTFRKVTTNVDKGVYMAKGVSADSATKLMGTAFAGAAGLLTVAPTAILYQSIKNRENFLTTMKNEYNEFTGNKSKYSLQMAKNMIGMSPFGEITGKKGFGHALITFGQLANRKVYNVEKKEFQGTGSSLVFMGSFILGASATKLINDFSKQDKSGGGSAAVAAYVRSPKFKAALEKETAKNIKKQLPGMYNRTYNQYSIELKNDKFIYDFTRGRK